MTTGKTQAERIKELEERVALLIQALEVIQKILDSYGMKERENV